MKLWKLYEIYIFIYKALLEHSHINLFTCVFWLSLIITALMALEKAISYGLF